MINIDSLSDSLSVMEQRHNVRTAYVESAEDVYKLILPPGRQDCWHNCAIVLNDLDDHTLLLFLPELLEWFRGGYKPGYNTMMGRIKRLPRKEVRAALAAVRQKAEEVGDGPWADDLDGLLRFFA